MKTETRASASARLRYIHGDFLMNVLRRGKLVAAPQAEILADPYIYGTPGHVVEIPVLFSDIPDAQFRKPKEIISMAHLGGTKS